MIKVMLLIPTLDRSGAEKQFTLLATHLQRSDFDVHAVALTRGGPYEADLREREVPVTILHKRWKFDPRTLRQLRNLIVKDRPDILHSWLFAANAYARLAAGATSRPKVLVSERCVDSWKGGWQKWLDRRQIGRTTRLIGNSQSVANFYQQLGVPREKIAVVPNGVAIPPEDDRDRAGVREEFDCPPDASLVGYVGRLARQKRPQDIVWGMQLLRQLRGNAYFLVVGDGPERDRMVRLARHMGCDHLMRFAGQRDDALRIIGSLDVLWLASEFEGMSNSVIEAMAAGVPVVASDIPPNRELVVDGETGYLVKVGDCVGFAQFTDRILADTSLRSRLGQAARARASEQFSIDSMVRSYAELYRQVLDDGMNG